MKAGELVYASYGSDGRKKIVLRRRVKRRVSSWELLPEELCRPAGREQAAHAGIGEMLIVFILLGVLGAIGWSVIWLWGTDSKMDPKVHESPVNRAEERLEHNAKQGRSPRLERPNPRFGAPRW